MLVYQWAFYYFTGIGHGDRRIKHGPLFTLLDEAKNHLNLIKIQYSSTFHIGFIYEYSLDDFCYGNIIYKTNDLITIDHDDCHLLNIVQELVNR